MSLKTHRQSLVYVDRRSDYVYINTFSRKKGADTLTIKNILIPSAEKKDQTP